MERKRTRTRTRTIKLMAPRLLLLCRRIQMLAEVPSTLKIPPSITLTTAPRIIPSPPRSCRSRRCRCAAAWWCRILLWVRRLLLLLSRPDCCCCGLRSTAPFGGCGRCFGAQPAAPSAAWPRPPALARCAAFGPAAERGRASLLLEGGACSAERQSRRRRCRCRPSRKIPSAGGGGGGGGGASLAAAREGTRKTARRCRQWPVHSSPCQ